jgi:hypothetical protein
MKYKCAFNTYANVKSAVVCEVLMVLLKSNRLMKTDSTENAHSYAT